jgi:hypothetical protein
VNALQTKQLMAAYELFVDIHADYTNQAPEQVRSAIPPQEFERRLQDLYSRWQAGEFSFGRFTELIGVPHAELWDILDTFGLKLHT